MPVETELSIETADQFLRLLQSARRLEADNAPFPEVLSAYEAAIAACVFRAEAHHGAARLCRLNGLYERALKFSSEGLKRPRPSVALQIEEWIYDYGLLSECSVSAYYAGRFEECIKLSELLLSKNVLTAQQAERVNLNAKNAKRKILIRHLMQTDSAEPHIELREANPNGSLGPLIRERQALKTIDSSIVRTIHIVWIGDLAKRPDQCINSWIEKNPTWNVILWGNDELRTINWENSSNMRAMLTRELCGVADMMRWEILYHHGGFAVDADSFCMRSLEDWLFEPEFFASWESEVARPGLVANGHVYSRPGNPLIRDIIDDIKNLSTLEGSMAWELTGPKRLTETIRKMNFTGVTVYPSHFFMPQHFTGTSYSGSGQVFARQFWGGSGNDVYNKMADGKIIAGH